MGVRMRSGVVTGLLPVFALGSLFSATALKADDAAPTNGVPEESIAKDWNDPMRASLAKQGVLYGLGYIGEYWNVAKGGNSQGSNYDGLVSAFVDMDLDKIMGWKGGAIHASAYYLNGIGPATQRIGNIFPPSNIEGDERLRLFELWFEQSMLDDKVKVRIGSLAADGEFFISETAGLFLNSTFGWSAATANNMAAGGPGYPLASLGVRVQYQPTDNLNILAAVFNGSPADPFAEDPQADNPHGVSFRLQDSPLLMVEAQYKSNLGLPGTFKFGGWKQFNHYAPEFLNPDVLDTSSGVYGIIDQQIWKGSGDEAISAFVRLGGSPDKQNLINTYVDTGIVFTGFVPGRKDDAFGAAFAYGHVSDKLQQAQIDAGQTVISDYESVIELNYAAKIRPGFTIAPDFQYIWNPGGRVPSESNPNKPEQDAAVFGVRTTLNY
jgi:porin